MGMPPSRSPVRASWTAMSSMWLKSMKYEASASRSVRLSVSRSAQVRQTAGAGFRAKRKRVDRPVSGSRVVSRVGVVHRGGLRSDRRQSVFVCGGAPSQRSRVLRRRPRPARRGRPTHSSRVARIAGGGSAPAPQLAACGPAKCALREATSCSSTSTSTGELPRVTLRRRGAGEPGRRVPRGAGAASRGMRRPTPVASRVRWLQQHRHRAADDDLAADHLGALEVEIAEFPAHELHRPLV